MRVQGKTFNGALRLHAAPYILPGRVIYLVFIILEHCERVFM
jgi:hypothetical protein